jgi:hypothetical protein
VSSSKNLKKLLASLRKTGGFEGFLQLLFGLGGTVNGFDQYSHFVRALVPTNNCFDQISIPQNGCNANFFQPSLKAKAKNPTKKDIKKALRDTARATHEGSVQANDAESQPSESPDGAAPGDETVPGAPTGDATGTTTTTEPPTTTTTTTPETTPPTAGEAPQQQQRLGASRQLMDFLLGDDNGGGRK